MSAAALFRWFLIINCLTAPRALRADEPLLKPCQSALRACDTLQRTQADEIAGLKGDVKTLENELAKAQPSGIPTYVWVILGLGAGVAVGTRLGR
jgi:hypothetical protein